MEISAANITLTRAVTTIVSINVKPLVFMSHMVKLVDISYYFHGRIKAAVRAFTAIERPIQVLILSNDPAAGSKTHNHAYPFKKSACCISRISNFNPADCVFGRIKISDIEGGIIIIGYCAIREPFDFLDFPRCRVGGNCKKRVRSVRVNRLI